MRALASSHRNTPPPVDAPITVPPRVTPRARPSRRTTRDWCCRRYQNGSGLLSRPGDFMVGHDDAVVRGKVRDNLLLVVDLLLVVQHEVLFFLILLLPLVPLLFFRLCLFFRTYLSSFKLHLSQSRFRSHIQSPPSPAGSGGSWTRALHFRFHMGAIQENPEPLPVHPQ